MHRPNHRLMALAALIGVVAAPFAATGSRRGRAFDSMPSMGGLFRKIHPRSGAFRQGAWPGDGILSKRRIKPRVQRTR